MHNESSHFQKNVLLDEALVLRCFPAVISDLLKFFPLPTFIIEVTRVNIDDWELGEGPWEDSKASRP